MFDQPQAWLTQIPRDQIVSESRQRRKLAANFRPAGAARTATAALEAAEQDRSHTSLSDISQPSNFYAPSQLMSSRIRKRGWLSPVSSQFFQCLIFGCLLLRSNVAQVTPPVGANARLFNPVMRWGRQILFACDKYTEDLRCEPGYEGIEPERVQEAGRWKACTSNPAVEYECSETNVVGCECNGLCLPVGPYNGTCYDMVLGMEDNWVELGLRVLHNPGLNQAIEFSDPLYSDDYIRVSVNVTYGSLDVYATSVLCDKWCPRQECAVCDQNCQSFCTVGKGNVTQVRQADVPLFMSMSWDRAVLNITDNWSQLDKHLTSVKYRPDDNVNTYKLRRERMQTQPWELLHMQVLYNNPSYSTSNLRAINGPWVEVGAFVQLVHIVDLNDPPRILPPVQTTLRCDASDLKPGQERPFECYFGQFWGLEDSIQRVEIPGVRVEDDDLDERCELGEECAQMDIEVRAFKGALVLNTRSDLTFYDIGDPDNRAGSGFTALLTAAQNAIKVLFYQVELGRFLGPDSKVLNYNTQHSGNVEYFTVTASDQGSNSWSGLASSTVIQVPLEIVATNDAPMILLQRVEFEAIEDLEQHLQGVSILDVDVEEEVDSLLAFEDWMGVGSERIFINQMSVTVTVEHGALKLGYLRNLKLVSTHTTAWMTVESLRFGHDACLVDNLKDDIDALIQAYPEGAELIRPYSEVCLLENYPSPTCQTPTDRTCRCFVDGTCTSDKIVLYLNVTDDPKAPVPLRRLQAEAFQTALTAAMNRVNRTCGGMPVYRNPNNFTQGILCSSNEDCRNLQECTPLVPGEPPGPNTCRCCSDLDTFCSDNTVCSEFDTGALCGCLPNGDGQCGPFYTSPNRAGPKFYDLIRVGDVDAAPKLYGQRCQYRGPGVKTCQAPNYAFRGTDVARIVELVALTSLGSSNFTFYGPMVDVNRAVAELTYISDPNYNRFYRPPVAEREFGFNIEADSVDNLDILANDMGNSGGLRREPKQSRVSATVRVKAVNDRPQANLTVFTDFQGRPLQSGQMAMVKAFEDLPLTFRDGENHPLRAPRLMFKDPDSNDYRYGEQLLTMNLSCTNGRLFLNEEYLEAEWAKTNLNLNNFDSEAFNPGLSAIRFVEWPGMQRRGLHSYSGQLGVSYPKFGNGCQFKPQCANGDSLKSTDTRYGFFKTDWYGVVYSPQIDGDDIPQTIGCGHCSDEVGNKFLSIEGTLDNINRALERVTYLPDPDFNTRSGQTEEIIFEVTDNGARGDDDSAPPLSDRLVINVVVESVNDRPFIGVRKSKTRALKAYDGVSSDRIVDDFAIEMIDKTIEQECFSLPPASDEYWEKCNPTKRRFIDIDEDTQFFIGPQVLWIVDVDAAEAEQMPTQRRYCCAEAAGDEGCLCGRACRCGAVSCRCSAPNVCQGGAGKILVSLKATYGLLSFYPPPGRQIFPTENITFLQNLTSIDIKDGGFTEPCPNQLNCMINVSRIMMETTIGSLQLGLEQLFLSYQGRPDWYGRDTLEVWVSDQGYTDECYNSSLAVVETVSIRVVGINDPPTLTVPSSVLVYQRGQRCYVDWQTYDTNDNGMIPACEAFPNISLVPPSPLQPLAFRDVDLGDTPDKVAEMSVIITIGNDEQRHGQSGGLMFSETRERTNMWLVEYVQEGLMTTMIQGSLDDINWLMQRLRYDADPSYQGYAPFVVNINDNLNYGECNGHHECGAFEAVCMDHMNAKPHVPADPGINRVVLDVVIGSAVRCAATDCESCNNEAGCGWCPGTCIENGGKCMIGGAGGPQFETCESDDEGRGWMQCEKVGLDMMTLGAALGGAFFGLAVLFYLFRRWALRRHGSIFGYMRKKRVDTALMMTKLNILPPEDANYNEFFALFLLGIAIVILVPVLMRTENAPCTFRRNFFLDKIASVQMRLDNCKVRFLPPRFSPPPENALEAPKVKLAFLEDPDIVLNADSCTQDATFELLNNRPDSVRYLGYYCNIEILVPDRYVLPEFLIEAAGENTTSVRVSATDSDSTEFGLDFGPNRFTLTGERLVANVQNISAKYFNYEVVHGALTAIDLSTTVSGTFTSNDADMTVTTKFRTSVDFWQKSGNKVCLSAAPNSMYVDDACQEVCVFRAANESTSAGRRSDVAQPEPAVYSAAGEESLRRLGVNTTNFFGLEITDPIYGDNRTKWICNGDPDIDEEWDCEPYNAQEIALSQACPVGSRYATKKDVPQVPGCTNLEFCMSLETSQCLCKKDCDMKGLGVCNEGGQCCSISCAGYSKADLFPTADQPRCGARIDPSLTWCDNNLDQKFTFTSDVGQISVQVLEDCDPSSPSQCSERPENSYKGGPPTRERIITGVNIPDDNKKILDDLFHPGGASAPNVDWFTLGLHGPGTADPAFGQFVFLKSVRHLVLQPWLMNVLSFALLTPTRSASSANLNPGFCPAFQDTDSTEFNTRLAEMYRLLLDTVQLYPPPPPPPQPQDEDEKIIPVNSLITFKRVSGAPKIFVTDTTTGKVSVSSIDPNDYPLLILLLILGIVIPVVAACGGTLLLFLKGRNHINEYRRSKLMQEHMMRNLGAVLAGGGPDPNDDDDVPYERVKEMRGRTGFFYIFEEFVGNAEAQRTLFAEWALVLSQLVTALLPPVFPFLVASIVEVSYKDQRCEYRYDICRCLTETDGILVAPVILRALVYAYFFVVMVEIGLHYLAVSYNWFRKVLRPIFYFLFFLMIWLTIVTTGTIFVFCILGVLVKATLTGPYALCVLGVLVVVVSVYVKRVKLMTRVSRAVTKRVVAYKNKVADNMPKPLLDAMMAKYITQSLHDHGLSFPKIVINIVLMVIGLCAIFFFLFTGFEAFTDPTDLNSALINMGIIVGIIVAAYQIMASDGDPSEMGHRVDMLTDSIMSQLEKILDMIAEQITRARELYDELEGRNEEEPGADEESEYDDYDDDEEEEPLMRGAGRTGIGKPKPPMIKQV